MKNLLLAVLCVWTIGCASNQAFGSRAKSGAGSTTNSFRVMTYNIHHGEGLDGKVDLLRIAQLIAAERADIVALQEVDKGVQRTARRDLPEELAALTGMTCVFSNNYHFQGGEYGNAVLTRFPVTSWINSRYKMIRTGEQRGLLQLRLRVHGHDLIFMNTHIDYRKDDTERRMNVEEIRQSLARYPGLPVIICGDFNTEPDSATYQMMKQLFSDSWETVGQGEGFSYPAGKPVKRIDYIFVRGSNAPKAVNAWVPQSDASDHAPVVAEFVFP
ncbi:MAG: endonuclease/exonuclease/phosphatase family protein [Opitutaceae bacterium]|nr:endonuclease/exonuclease/phosphatase family protein [Verrucomicrobiales bacterium]